MRGQAQRGAEAAIGGCDLQAAIVDAGLRLFAHRDAALILFGGELRHDVVDLLILLLEAGFHDRRRRGGNRRGRRNRFRCGHARALAAQGAVQSADFFFLGLNLLLLRLDHLQHLTQPFHHGIIVGSESRRGGQDRGGRAKQKNAFHEVPLKSSSVLFP